VIFSEKFSNIQLNLMFFRRIFEKIEITFFKTNFFGIRMAFLDDYCHSKKNWWKRGTGVLVCTGLVGGYLLGDSGETIETKSIEPQTISYQEKNLYALENLARDYNSGNVSIYRGLEEDTTQEDVERIMLEISKLPEEERYQIMKDILKDGSKNAIHDVKDYAENNLDELLFFLVGGN
jgi:hypothetical protein